MSRSPRQVLFCPPTYFEVRDVKNPFMEGAAPVERALAQRQWENVRAAFAAAGVEPQAIDAVEGLEDMVFAANQTFVGADPQGKRFVVPSNMRYPSRRLEVPHYVRWFRDRGFELVELDLSADEFLEGGGDLLWQEPTLIWAGHGFRSTPSALEKFARAMHARGLRVVPLRLTDARFYHLDTCLAPLRDESVLIYPGAFSAPALDAIRAHCPRVYEVSEADALGFVCNGVSAGEKFITGRITPSLELALAAENLEPVVVNTSEFEKSGGSVCCLKMFL